MAKQGVKKSTKQNQRSLLKRVFGTIGSFLKKITGPIRHSKVWKFLRRTILRSPFRGYFVSSWKELKKVTWPNRKTTIRLTFIVIVFTIIFSAFTTALDYGFENLAKEVFLR